LLSRTGITSPENAITSDRMRPVWGGNRFGNLKSTIAPQIAEIDARSDT
jgi:hypothetical protein